MIKRFRTFEENNLKVSDVLRFIDSETTIIFQKGGDSFYWSKNGNAHAFNLEEEEIYLIKALSADQILVYLK